MLKKYLYFQPEYVREFRCDGSKCNARCCKSWNIEVDRQTHALYSHVKPVSVAQEILSHLKATADGKSYLVDMGAKKVCPFLTENNLCRLQRDYGENFLSLTCMTFPRFTWNFGQFFERSMSLTCPVAAEMILFRDAPLSFELLETVEDDKAKVGIMSPPVPPEFAAHFVDTQVAMISILQERTLTIDQRLIVSGFFLDRLNEIISGGLDVDALTKLIAAYESKSFLSTQVPKMLAAVNFDAKKFVGRMLEIIDTLRDEKFSAARELLANRKAFVDARKKFLARYPTLLENFLVNELFLTCFPWRYKAGAVKNFAVFVATYKLFELLALTVVQQNLCGKRELLQLVDWLAGQTNHSTALIGNLLKQFAAADDIVPLLETFLETT